MSQQFGSQSGSTILIPPRRRRRWLSVLLAIVLFLSGVLIGGAGVTLFIASRVQQAMQHPELMPDRMTIRLTRRLSLSKAQADQVHALLEQRLPHLQALRIEVQPRLETEFNGFSGDVQKILTPAQQAKWTSLYSDLMKNWMPPSVGPTTAPAD